MRVEKGVDRIAAVLLAAACAYAAYAWLSAGAGQPMAAAETAVAGLLIYLAGVRGLNAIQPASPRVPVAIFDVRDVEPYEDAAPSPGEAVEPSRAEVDDALLLDDILAELAPDSRVVRLFDPAAMPTAGELQSRIDRHLDASAAHSVDAAQALHDALAELRRSIR